MVESPTSEPCPHKMLLCSINDETIQTVQRTRFILILLIDVVLYLAALAIKTDPPIQVKVLSSKERAGGAPIAVVKHKWDRFCE